MHSSGESLNPKAESSQHFASSKTGNGKRSNVEILPHPFPFQRDFQDGCPQRPANMRTPLTPIQACVGEAPTEHPSFFDVYSKSRKRPDSISSKIVGVVGTALAR